MECKARRALSSGAGNRAAAKCPAGAPHQLPGANPVPFSIPLSRQHSAAPKPLEKHSNFFPLGRGGASPCCQAAAPLLSFWGALGSPEACHQAVERVARRSSAIHLPHAFRSQRQHDAPVPEAGMLLPLPAAPRRGQGGGTSLPGNLCGSRAGEEASAPRVPPRRVAPLLFVCRGSFRRPKAPIQK